MPIMSMLVLDALVFVQMLLPHPSKREHSGSVFTRSTTSCPQLAGTENPHVATRAGT
jgi:hypothetical protein